MASRPSTTASGTCVTANTPRNLTSDPPRPVAGSGKARASWVEVTRADGTRLEYGLLPAGSHTVYHSDQPLNVSIGNVGGAQVAIDGQAVEMDDFRRANVAHFRVQVQDGKASATAL